jgi:hypothetical protein
MVFVTWKIDRYPFSSNAWSTSAITLTEYFDPQVQLATGDGKDSFSFKATNFNNTLSNYFKPNDKLIISRAVNTTTIASSDVIITGSVKNVPEETSGTTNQIRVEGNNFSDTMLGGIVFFDPNGATIPNAIQAALASVGNYNSNFVVTWSSTNPTVDSNGNAFPAVTEKWFNRPIKDFIIKYSTDQATGDGNYFGYVNASNEFVWGKKSGAEAYTFDSTTDDYTRLRINKDLKDVKNWVIIKGGTDPNGSPIQTRVEDLSSIARNGLKPYILTSITKSAETLVKVDKDFYGVTDMKDASYPLTPPWSSGSVVNYIAYVAALRVYVEAQCKVEGNSFLQGRSGGKLKVDVSFPPGKAWGRGDLIACNIPSISSIMKKLRVVEIQYTDDSDTFTLVEDIGSL